MPRRSSPRTLKTLVQGFFRLYPYEAARMLEKLPVSEIARLLESEPVPRAAAVLERLAPDLGYDALRIMPEEVTSRFLSAMEPGAAALLMARFDSKERTRRLKLLPAPSARMIELILSYPKECAGGLMDPRVMTFHPDTTVKEILSRLRPVRERRISDIFVTDPEGRLQASVPLQDVAVAPPVEPVSALIRSRPASINAMALREEVVETMERFRLASLPVVDFEERVLGVIRHDGLVAAAEQEVSADIQTMVGVSKEERALSGVGLAVRKRLPWLQINLATAFLAAAVVGMFEGLIMKFTALAVLLPVVAGQSGNTGAQALAVTMRGLALREVRVHQWLRILTKELRVGFFNGLAVAATTSSAVYIWSRSPGLALVIGLSMVCSMVAASISGVAIPMLLTAMGQDPAQSSSIILTTVTDVVGFFSFLGIASLLSGML
jgi:magnesium transporter